MEYKIISQGIFESERRFETRINELARMGWRINSVSHKHSITVVVMEKATRTA